ncbi:MAG TPA: molybdopterin-synthase adenylyltransferase MoeB [Armatimonadota bacterium]|jgi:adenylyltransferase/sulfurtransferase
MSVTVTIPAPLRRYTDDQDSVQAEGHTVGAVLEQVVAKYDDLRKSFFDREGNLRRFVKVFLNDDDIDALQGAATRLNEGDTLVIVPSIAGGTDVVDAAAVDRVTFSQEEYRRYNRHMIMPEVGEEGQKRLKASRVLVVGTGGLGSPVGLYLAAAGVGTLGLVDFDVVDDSNLHRQVIFGVDDVGLPKVEAAKQRLQQINPFITINTYNEPLTSENAMEIIRDYDVVVDGTDNFPTRYLVNDACVLLGIPNVYGSIFRFDGQISVFWAEKGPCYRCLYPEPPPPGLVPSCAEGGVLGVLPGIVGCLQANEAIKLIIGQGNTMVGRLALFDALEMKIRELKLRKNPDCPVCGEHPTIHELIDYNEFCGVPHLNQTKEEPLATDEISVEQLKQRLDAGTPTIVFDVREPSEYQIARLGGSTLIPLGDLPQRYTEIPRDGDVVIHCKLGGRSRMAVDYLKSLGYTNVKNLAGGITAWSQQIDSSVPTY